MAQHEQSPSQAVLENNFRTAIGNHTPFIQKINLERRSAGELMNGSTDEESGRAVVDREIEEVALGFGLTEAELRSRAAEGVVVDIGAGRSSLLASVDSGRNQLVAVDIRRGFLEYQSSLGLTALTTVLCDGHAIGGHLAKGSVRTLFANFSLPYWSPSREKAARFCDTVIDLLEPGCGSAYIGSIVPDSLESHWEASVAGAQDPASESQPPRPWGSVLPSADRSIVVAEFGSRLLHHLDRGVVTVEWTRAMHYEEQPSVPREFSVPNFAHITRTAS